MTTAWPTAPPTTATRRPPEESQRDADAGPLSRVACGALNPDPSRCRCPGEITGAPLQLSEPVGRGRVNRRRRVRRRNARPVRPWAGCRTRTSMSSSGPLRLTLIGPYRACATPNWWVCPLPTSWLRSKVNGPNKSTCTLFMFRLRGATLGGSTSWLCLTSIFLETADPPFVP